MESFESVIILKPELTKTEREGLTKSVENTIKKVAEITNKEDLGLKRLAYDIKGKKEGYYVVHQFEFSNDVDSVSSIEKYFRTQEEIIKFIIVKRD